MSRKQTRNAQGGGTIRWRSDGRWEARYTKGRDPGTGKQIQKSIYGKTQAEVRKKLQQACIAIDEGTYMEPSKLTVGEWLEIWVENYTENLKPYSKKSYNTQIKKHIKPALGAIKLTSLNTVEIQRFYNRLLKGVEDNEPLSPKTIKNIHGVLHKALKQAVEIGYLKYNVSEACKLPRVQKVNIKPLEEKEIAAFLEAVKGHQYENIYVVDLFTGMRQGEILGLTWDCINFKNGTIFIYRQLQKIEGEYRFVSLKNDKARRIMPAPAVMRVLQNQKRIQNEWKLKASTAWENSELVFTNQLGGHLSHFTVYKHFKRIVREIGVPNARFHDLRHSYAVVALQAGDDLKTVQETLGHHAASFTLDVYGHVSERMMRDSSKRMEEFIKGITKKEKL